MRFLKFVTNVALASIAAISLIGGPYSVFVLPVFFVVFLLAEIVDELIAINKALTGV